MRIGTFFKDLTRSERFVPRALATSGMKSFGVVVSFLFNIIIARVLGPEDAGRFFLVLTILLTLSIFVRFGLDNALIKFVSTTKELGKSESLQNYLFSSIGIVLAIGLVTSAVVYMMIDAIDVSLFPNIEMRSVFLIMLTALIPSGVMWVTIGFLRGLRKPARAAYLETASIPAIAILLIALFMIADTVSVDVVAISYVIATIITVIIAMYFVNDSVPLAINFEREKIQKIINTAYPMMLAGMAGFLVTWAPSLILGSFVDSASVANYNIAFRTAALLGFVLIVVNSITSPRFAAYYNNNNIEELHALAVKAAMLMTAVVTPVVIVIFLWPHEILRLFGEDFVTAVDMLLIMTIAQFINVVTGSVGHILMMTGHEKLMRNIMLLTAVLSISTSIYFIQIFGAVGSAIAVALCMTIRNILMTWFVYKKLGIVVIPTPSNIKKILISV